jgi:hypothetical protein
MLRHLWLTLALLAAPCGCVEKDQRQEGPPGPAVTEQTPGAFDAQLLEVARTYESFGLAAEEVRMTNVLCLPITANSLHGVTTPEHTAKASTAPDSSPHGKKLYFLFVKMPDPPTAEQPVGQVVVKEAWVPEEVKGGKTSGPIRRKLKVRRGGEWVEMETDFDPYVRRDGKLYHAREKAGLFILLKLQPGTPGTDAGWVYGTVTPDGKQVTFAGRVESCMGCHQQARHDRLFEVASR